MFDLFVVDAAAIVIEIVVGFNLSVGSFATTSFPIYFLLDFLAITIAIANNSMILEFAVYSQPRH